MFEPLTNSAQPKPIPVVDTARIRREREDRQLRDEIAVDVMWMIFNGEGSAWEWEDDEDPEVYDAYARQAYYVADAMMKARNSKA